MSIEDESQPNAEREQTDESLRLEREKADNALNEMLAAIDETADAVINLARDRADRVVAKARSEADRKTGLQSPMPTLARERTEEDRSVVHERATADEARRWERSAHTAELGVEREETDKDLSTERTHHDRAIATRDAFLQIVSHDLNNLLTGVTGSATLIDREIAQMEGNAKLLKYTQRIRNSTTRMGRLIGDLVDVASIEAGALAVTPVASDPGSVVREAVEIFQQAAAAHSVSVVSAISGPAAAVLLDPARVLQVLTNLLSNAIKFSKRGESVLVSVECVGDEIRFSVKDSGVGIPADRLTTVFERYKQLHPNDRRGVGLGLYISKSIVHGHGGRIWAESEAGKGSTFYFTLPMAPVSTKA